MSKPKKPWKGASGTGTGRPAWEVWLWLATDGEVVVAEKIPPGGPDAWLGFPANPPLDRYEAQQIVTALCDLAPPMRFEDGVSTGDRWFFRSDPRTQNDLWRQFQDAVMREAAKRVLP